VKGDDRQASRATSVTHTFNAYGMYRVTGSVQPRRQVEDRQQRARHRYRDQRRGSSSARRATRLHSVSPRLDIRANRTFNLQGKRLTFVEP
jgi:hypothetical protein